MPDAHADGFEIDISRERIAQALRDCMRNWPACRFVVTFEDAARQEKPWADCYAQNLCLPEGAERERVYMLEFFSREEFAAFEHSLRGSGARLERLETASDSVCTYRLVVLQNKTLRAADLLGVLGKMTIRNGPREKPRCRGFPNSL